MRHLSKILLLLLALGCLGGTWIASPGKGSHAAAGGGPAALRSSSFTTYTSRTTNTTITAPTGITNGDILIIAFFALQSTAPTYTLPSGFTTIQGPSNVTVGGVTMVRTLGWKLAASEAGDYVVDHGGANTYSTQGVMFCVSGCANATPVSSNNSGTGSTTTATGITTPSNNAFVAFVAHNWAGYGTATAPTGTTPTFTELVDTGVAYAATGILATAGATGDKTQSNLNGGSDGWAAFLVSCGP